jgi:hypothetical protein
MIGDQAVDFTQVDNNRLKSAFELKKQKYGFIYNNKQVLPVVVTHNIQLNSGSLNLLKGLVNLNRLLAEMACHLIRGNMMRIVHYEQNLKNSAQDKFDYWSDKLKTTKPASNEHVKTMQQQVKNAEIHIEIAANNKPKS